MPSPPTSSAPQGRTFIPKFRRGAEVPAAASTESNDMDIDDELDSHGDELTEQQEDDQYGLRSNEEQPLAEPTLDNAARDLQAALEDPSTQLQTHSQALQPPQQTAAALDTSPAGMRKFFAEYDARKKRKADEEHSAQTASKRANTVPTSAAAATATKEDTTMTDVQVVAVNAPSSVVPVTIPSAAPQVAAAPPIAKLRYQDILNFSSTNIKCALQLTVDGTDWKPIGNPFNNPMGISADLHLDGGKYGDPKVSLRFRINKMDKKQNVAANINDCHVFSITWFPGNSLRESRMMEDFAYRGGEEGVTNPLVQNEDILSLPNAKEKWNQLVWMAFTSSSSQQDVYQESWAYGLPQGTQDTLKELFSETGSREIAMWFLNPMGTQRWEQFSKFMMLPIQQAVEYQIPAMRQYLNETFEFKPDLDTYPTIQEVGGGMYCKQSPKTNEPEFYTVPKTWTWKSLQEFNIYGSTHVMRDRHYVKGQAAAIGLTCHRAYVQEFPRIDIDYTVTGKKSEEEKKFTYMYRFYIRQSKGPNGIRDPTPEQGQEIEISWDTSIAGYRPHEEPAKQQRLYGTVQPAKEQELRATRCDFMVLVYKQRTASIRKTIAGELHYVPDEELPPCHINVKLNDGPAKRELEAMHDMSNPSYEDETLGPIRLALIGEPSRMKFTQTDLTEGVATTKEDKAANRQLYTQYIQQFEDLENPDRIKVLNCVRELSNNIAVIQGPPGTAKTTTIAIVVTAMIMCGHTVAFTAPSNPAVDTAAMAVYKLLPQKYKTVRLELFSREKENLTQKEDDFSDPSQLKKARNVQDPMDNPRVAQQFAKVVAEMVENDNAVMKFRSQLDAHSEAVKQASSDLKAKVVNVPIEQTLGYRIYDRIQQDMAEAVEEYNKRKDAITDITARADFVGLHEVVEFDKSSGYRAIMRLYDEKEGRLTEEQTEKFKQERTMMIARVLGEMDAIFATCVNSGSDWITDHFVPTIVCIDEAGQVTIPSACVPLTKFKGYKGVLLFGDINQLKPTVLSAGLNEFIANARTSLMGLLIGKGFPIFKLRMQYRSDPEITAFPSKQFYEEGDYIDHPMVKTDNPTKQKMRAVSMKHYNIKTDQGGRVYWFVNVVYGVARVEPNGTSLQNHANAAAIATAVDRLLKEGILASQISILTIYRGNINVIGDAIEQHLIRETTAPGAADKTWERTSVGVFTTDSFQGKETDISLVDMVTASDEWDSLAKNAANQTDRYTSLSGHVKDPNRLCVTLTRARYGEIIFGQAQSLLNSSTGSNLKKTRIANSVALLVQDAIDREIMYEDTVHLDTHPEGVKAREKIPELKKQQARKVEEANRLQFITRHVKKLRTHAFSDEVEEKAKVPVYQTESGRTTRPLDTDHARAADKHDQEPVSLVPDKSGKSWADHVQDEVADAQGDKVMKDGPPPPPAAGGTEDMSAKKAGKQPMPKEAGAEGLGQGGASKQTSNRGGARGKGKGGKGGVPRGKARS